MNSPSSPPSRKWLWFVLSLGFVFALIAYGVCGFFWLSRDAASLRNGLVQATAAKWDKQIELRVGPMTLLLAEAGLSFIDLPPEARLAVKAVRGAEVGVYRLPDGQAPVNRSALLAAGDAAMARRGWDRIVGVLNHDELVAVYAPRKTRSFRDVRVCVAVLSDQELVIVSARGNVQPLVDLAMQQGQWRPHFKDPTRLLVSAGP